MSSPFDQELPHDRVRIVKISPVVLQEDEERGVGIIALGQRLQDLLPGTLPESRVNAVEKGVQIIRTQRYVPFLLQIDGVSPEQLEEVLDKE